MMKKSANNLADFERGGLQVEARQPLARLPGGDLARAPLPPPPGPGRPGYALLPRGTGRRAPGARRGGLSGGAPAVAADSRIAAAGQCAIRLAIISN